MPLLSNVFCRIDFLAQNQHWSLQTVRCSTITKWYVLVIVCFIFHPRPSHCETRNIDIGHMSYVGAYHNLIFVQICTHFHTISGSVQSDYGWTPLHTIFKFVNTLNVILNFKWGPLYCSSKILLHCIIINERFDTPSIHPYSLLYRGVFCWISSFIDCLPILIGVKHHDKPRWSLYS